MAALQLLPIDIYGFLASCKELAVKVRKTNSFSNSDQMFYWNQNNEEYVVVCRTQWWRTQYQSLASVCGVICSLDFSPLSPNRDLYCCSQVLSLE